VSSWDGGWPPAMPTDARPTVSIIIPTYRDWDRLRVCLDALAVQTYPRDRIEVIVVNNDPANAPGTLAFPGTLRLVDEETPGSYAARNAGLRVAGGDVLLFTDADCVPEPRWVEEAVAGTVVAVAARVGATRLLDNLILREDDV